MTPKPEAAHDWQEVLTCIDRWIVETACGEDLAAWLGECRIEAIQAALTAQIGLAAGTHVVVQKEASLEQRMAGMRAWDMHMKAHCDNVSWPEMMDIVWQAMIEAAPTITASEE